MIRSTQTTLKFSNTNKLNSLEEFIKEYKKVVIQFVDILWEEENPPKILPKDYTSQIDTWLSQRMIQSAGKQASGIVRGTRQKQKQRKYVIEQLIEKNHLKKARKLQKKYDETKVSKPNIQNVQPELDSRFVKIDLNNKTTSFDGWITIQSIGRKMKIVLPFKRSKHFNKMMKKGEIKSGIRLSKKDATFMFEIPDKEEKTKGSTLGIDIGQKSTLSCSDGIQSKKDIHGHDLLSITEKLSRKTKDSKAFHKAQTHRENYIHWSVNQLNLKKYKQVNIENIKYLRFKRRSSRRLSHWTYSMIFDKIESYCEEHGVHVQRVTPTYTSQRCSQCGWTRKRNRKGKMFKCGKCGYAADADLNAAINISLPLLAISKKQRLQQINKKGFYWKVEGQECIVPAVKKH